MYGLANLTHSQKIHASNDTLVGCVFALLSPFKKVVTLTITRVIAYVHRTLSFMALTCSVLEIM
jgi:hypothetical protein